MTTTSTFIGIDPGPVPGIVELHVIDRVLADVYVIQCTDKLAPSLLRSRLDLLRSTEWGKRVTVQIEQFIVGRRAARSSTASAGTATRNLISQLQDVVTTRYTPLYVGVHLRPAAAVKPWASDQRLDVAGLSAETKGMRHARDAARHALYVAVHEGGLPDPLSKEWKR